MKLVTRSIVCLFFVALVMADGDDDSEEDPNLTSCQRARKRSLKNKADMKIIFECDEDGNYNALQCFHNSKFCVCYSADGEPISSMSSKIKYCECRREAEIAESKGPGAYVPSCAEDGSYKKKQCHASRGVCWCVDKFGKKTTEETSDPLAC
uniref:Venom toxin n=1 Tax=Hemiscorpius lepturus TaxID=520031 RepID=A0A1L4BJA1_HEMLE|nr:venom toxin [Hemiscorpius lepturus]